MARESGTEEGPVTVDEQGGGPERSEDPHQGLLDHPHGWTFFAAVRLLQQMREGRPAIGSSHRIEDDVIRFRQAPRLSFTPAEILRVERREGAKGPVMEMTQGFFGFFGPRGPLPLHITEDALIDPERSQLLVDFCNMLQHRMTALLYKGWSAGNPAASRDVAERDPFKRYLDALVGTAPPGFAGRTPLPDDTRRYLSGRLSNGNGSASALAAVVETVIDVPVDVDTQTGEWLTIPAGDRSCLGRGAGVSAVLGESIVLGAHSFSMQTSVTIATSPLTLDTYRRLLPGGALSGALWSGIRHAVAITTAVRLRLVLEADAVPPCILGGQVRLGYDTWLLDRNRRRPGADLTLTDQRG